MRAGVKEERSGSTQSRVASRRLEWFQARALQMRGPRSKGAISAREITGLCSSAINMSVLN